MSLVDTPGRSPKPKLQLTNGYEVHLDQLARLLYASDEDPRPKVPRAALEAALGLAGRKVENLCSIAQGLGLIQPVALRPTPLGKLIQEADTFFNDLGTLWFLHYVVASEPRHIVWNVVVNQVVPRGRRFTRTDCVNACGAALDGHSQYTRDYHVRQEVHTVLDAYLNQGFARLAYLRPEGEAFALAYRESVPPLVLAAAIARFRDRHRPGASAIGVAELLDAENSPGRVFQLGEERLREGLESLRREPGLSLESRADLDQLRLTDGTPDHVWMERYYASR